MIKVRCRSNDDYLSSQRWPVTFVCRPVLGDNVEAKNGSIATICGITHTERTEYNDYIPSLVIELKTL